MMKKRIVSFVLAAMLFMIFILPVSAYQSLDNSTQPLPHSEFASQIQLSNTSLTDKQAAVLANYVQKQLFSKYAGLYTFDHFSFEFGNEKIESDKFSIDVNVNVDMTLIRNPIDSPYVKGMQTAVSELRNEHEKMIGQNEIDAFLQETESYYNTPSPSTFLYRMEIGISSPNLLESIQSLNYDIQLTLFDRADITTEETIVTPATSERLDESMAADYGKKAINEAVTKRNGIANHLAISYNRLAARDYALAHAFDVPEFSAANGMGSDCANFVSKALNAGGIPVNRAGKWYPSTSRGNYAGENWMRTGYYNNGGVVPYMLNKGYFSRQNNISKVYSGSILYRTDTSHVALVTYGDGTTVKYTEHSNYPVTRKNIVYTGTRANFYTP
ncbi:amidase domain-containing protein [Paenibacillus sp. B1-33]|uniref:amidase domain-containing protein n=1 Tax=unclassified Paenibacillus TaxID=185978 RepID=UPI003D294CEB